MLKLIISKRLTLLLLVGGLVSQLGAWSSGTLAESGRQVTDDLEINWKVSGAGGAIGTTGGYRLSGTVGQTAATRLEAPALTLAQGFWQDLAPFVCGDFDGDGLVNITDAVVLVWFVFGAAAPPSLYLAGDTDCNGLVNISDAVYIVAFIFQGGAAPCASCE